MKTSFARISALLVSVLASTPFMRAHPGHDENELTWDFSHLAAYPLVTTGCLAVMIAAGAIGWFLLRRSATLRVQSLRGSQPSAGK
jgi:hydrogenase/urease accessory protein HupE